MGQSKPSVFFSRA